MQILSKILDLLDKHERRRVVLLMFMILIMAILDMIGVASILPFMAVLAEPKLIETNLFLNEAFQFSSAIGVQGKQEFLSALGIIVFVFLVFSLIFKALTTYAQLRFALLQEYFICKRLVEGYLHQPYSWFLDRNSADLGKSILSEVGIVVGNGIVPMMTLVAQSAVTLCLLILVLIIDPLLAITVGGVLGIAYALVLILMNGLLDQVGIARIQANQERFTAISEAFGAIKEVKVGGLEFSYIKRFSKPAKIYAEGQATARVIAQLPRFALEAIAFGGMLLITLYLMASSESFKNTLPVIALYAFAGYKLMPAIQQIYQAVTELQYAKPALIALHSELKNLSTISEEPFRNKTMQLKREIILNNIEYSYPNSAKPALNGINLSIPAHSKIGIIGSTGSGKTTTVDMILALLEAQSGALIVDGIVINKFNSYEWQQIIGYVPQQIYLADESLAANIAFGVNSINIDYQAVESAAKIANIHDFIVNELPEGYNTSVGERGVRLSGGQRQRIGIARALYNNPQVLIFDEATSALDNLTEKVVIEAVNNLAHGITIIMIAHRLSTVRQCDKIYLLENGKVKACGNYNQLSTSSVDFAAMEASK